MEQKSHGVKQTPTGKNALEEAPNQSAVEERSDILNVPAVVSISAGAIILIGIRGLRALVAFRVLDLDNRVPGVGVAGIAGNLRSEREF